MFSGGQRHFKFVRRRNQSLKFFAVNSNFYRIVNQGKFKRVRAVLRRADFSFNQTRLEIKIKDEGVGYSLEQILKRSSGDVSSKSGRGLQIIAHAVDSCTIDNYGKEITLSFLRENKENRSIQNLSSVPEFVTQTDISNGKVLIIEDNKSNQALLAGLLTQIGIHKIEIASTGKEGIEKAVLFHPDLIILDIVMENMDGYEVLLALKKMPDVKNIPILIQTSSDTREARDRTFKAGASDFITKPINPLEFFTRVRVHLENKKLVEYLSSQLAHRFKGFP